jgi:hypothetical protein
MELCSKDVSTRWNSSSSALGQEPRRTGYLQAAGLSELMRASKLLWTVKFAKRSPATPRSSDYSTTEKNGVQERFYLARIRQWSFDDRTGPEFSETGRGEYLLEEVLLTVEALDAVNLKPDEIALLLREAIQQGDLLARINPRGPAPP